MQIIILAGGKGKRLGEKYKDIPKPFIKVDKYSIIEKLIQSFNKFNYKDFIICCDHRVKVAESLVSKNIKEKNNIKFVNTGKNSNTLLRIYKVKKFINKSFFFVVYGDGIANINFKKLIEHHEKSKKKITLTCYPFTPDKGILYLNMTKKKFKFYEKIKLNNFWINIGYFVINTDMLKFIENKNISFERKFINKYIKENKVNFYKFNKTWMCLDHCKDLDKLKLFFKKKKL